MTIPPWALTLSYWLHMLATVVWIGGLAAITLLLVPAARTLDDPEKQARLLETAQRRLDPLAWFCLALLTATGLIQMSANPQYAGFLAIANRWGAAILFKHLVFFGMAGVSAYLTWVSLPALRRAVLRRSGAQTAAELALLRRRNLQLLYLNLALGVIVLALTALARASV